AEQREPHVAGFGAHHAEVGADQPHAAVVDGPGVRAHAHARTALGEVDERPGEPRALVIGIGEPALLLARRAPFVGPRVVEQAQVAADVAAVLARAHAAGVVHGPLRPEHLLGGPGQVLVTGWTDAGAGDAADDVAELGRLLERIADGDGHLLATAGRAQAPGR